MMRLGGILISLLLLLPASAAPQGRTISELATYNGKDREALLYAGAKSEGKVVWYTSLAGESYKAIARGFEAKYPGVRLDAYRAGGTELIPRMMEEAKARRPVVDAVETTEDSLLFAKTDFLIRPYYSPHLAKYPDQAKQKAERGLTFWTTIRESYLGFGYNKSQIPANAVPKNFAGLLHPALKKKIGITLTESSAKMIGAMIRIHGEAFVKKLKAQDIRAYTVSSAALVDLIASGEIGASLHIFRNHAAVSAERGSSVGWVPMDLVPTNTGGVALATQPPHPSAAMLLVDYLLTDAVQILDKYHYGHPNKNYDFQRWYQDQGRTVEQLEKDAAKWEKLAKEITRR